MADMVFKCDQVNFTTYISLSLCSYFVKIIFKDTSEAVTQRCSVRKLFLEISQNSQENTCTIVAS